MYGVEWFEAQASVIKRKAGDLFAVIYGVGGEGLYLLEARGRQQLWRRDWNTIRRMVRAKEQTGRGSGSKWVMIFHRLVGRVGLVCS